MIESIGYTEDGLVWMKVLVQHEDKQATIMLTMPESRARDVSQKLILAADEVTKMMKVLQ